MRITTSTTVPERATADVLAVAVGKPPSLTGAAAAVDRALGGTLGRLIESGEIRGAKGQVTVVHAAGGVRAKRVAVVGLGASPGPAEVRLAAAGAVRAAAAARAKSVAFALDGVPLERGEATRCVVDGGALAGYRFTRYLTVRRRRPAGRGRLALDPRRRPRPGAALGRPHRGDEPGPRPPEHAAARHGAAGAGRARQGAREAAPVAHRARARPGVDGAARDGPLPGRRAGVLAARRSRSSCATSRGGRRPASSSGSSARA